MKKERQLLLLMLILAELVGTVVGPGHPVSLSHVSTLYVPRYNDSMAETFSYDTEVVTSLALHPSSKLIYAIGYLSGIYVIDANDVSNLVIKDYFPLPELELTYVAVCRDAVFVTYRNSLDFSQGGLRVYTVYDNQTETLGLLHDLTTLEPFPDMVKTTWDCGTTVVALNNMEVYNSQGDPYDAPGEIGIVRFPSGLQADPEVKLLNFTGFDEGYEDLAGIHRASDGKPFSTVIRPKHVTFNHDVTKAYVSVMVNNAVAVVDLTTDTITDLYGLGFKSWGELDPSDQDGGINITEWPLYSLYQPEAIEGVFWNGQQYVVTANEGSYTDDRLRGLQIPPENISDSVGDELKQALQEYTLVGDLRFSTVNGLDSEGKFEKFVSFGARSISIWRASDMRRVYDSGSDIEKETAQRRPDIFNCDNDEYSTIEDERDDESDYQGPGPESLAVGELYGRLLIFAGCDKPGTIVVYSVAPGRLQPQFQTLFSDGIPTGESGSTWGELYDRRLLYAVDPQSMEFVPASKGLADFPFVLAIGALSGTVSILKVEVAGIPEKPTVENISIVTDPEDWSVVLTCDISEALSVFDQFLLHVQEVYLSDSGDLDSPEDLCSFPGTRDSSSASGRCVYYGPQSYRSSLTATISNDIEVYQGRLEHRWKLSPFPAEANLTVRVDICVGYEESSCVSVTRRVVTGMSTPSVPRLSCDDMGQTFENGSMTCTCSADHMGSPEGRLMLIKGGQTVLTGDYGDDHMQWSVERVTREQDGREMMCQLDWVESQRSDVQTMSVAYGPDSVNVLVSEPEEGVHEGQMVIECFVRDIKPALTAAMVEWEGELCQGQEGVTCVLDPDDAPGNTVSCHVTNEANNGMRAEGVKVFAEDGTDDDWVWPLVGCLLGCILLLLIILLVICCRPQRSGDQTNTEEVENKPDYDRPREEHNRHPPPPVYFNRVPTRSVMMPMSSPHYPQPVPLYRPGTKIYRPMHDF